MTKALLAGLLSMTAACAPVPPAAPGEDPVPVHGGTGRQCDAAAAQALVGREATGELGAEALRLSGAGPLRWIPPNSAVTMDYRPDRLNIELDAANMVMRIRCG